MRREQLQALLPCVRQRCALVAAPLRPVWGGARGAHPGQVLAAVRLSCQLPPLRVDARRLRTVRHLVREQPGQGSEHDALDRGLPSPHLPQPRLHGGHVGAQLYRGQPPQAAAQPIWLRGGHLQRRLRHVGSLDALRVPQGRSRPANVHGLASLWRHERRRRRSRHFLRVRGRWVCGPGRKVDGRTAGGAPVPGRGAGSSSLHV